MFRICSFSSLCFSVSFPPPTLLSLSLPPFSFSSSSFSFSQFSFFLLSSFSVLSHCLPCSPLSHLLPLSIFRFLLLIFFLIFFNFLVIFLWVILACPGSGSLSQIKTLGCLLSIQVLLFLDVSMESEGSPIFKKYFFGTLHLSSLVAASLTN